MKLKGISLWVEFLIYSAFAIFVISLVLYYFYDYTEINKSKIIANNILDFIKDLDITIKNVNTFYQATFYYRNKFFENTQLYLGDSWINITFISRINATYIFSQMNGLKINETKVGNIYIYNLSYQTSNFTYSGKIPLTGNEICLILNKTPNLLNISNC